MDKYYVSGCKDNGSEIETCDDSAATFWTLYERDVKGLSQGIVDLRFREDAEAVMAVYVERDALQKQVKALAEFRSKVYRALGAGELAGDFAIFIGIGNAMRRSDCLSAIEREFFTTEVPDEDYPEEMSEECSLNWGEGPKGYVEDFRSSLREIKAQGVDEFVSSLDGATELWHPCDVAEEFAAQLRAKPEGEQP